MVVSLVRAGSPYVLMPEVAVTVGPMKNRLIDKSVLRDNGDSNGKTTQLIKR